MKRLIATNVLSKSRKSDNYMGINREKFNMVSKYLKDKDKKLSIRT